MKAVAPCEGTGYEIGSMSIVKGARNLDNAKKFYDWALTPKAQALAARAKQFQMPSNVATPVSPLSPKTSEVKLIDYDFAKYGTLGRAQATARALGPRGRLDREMMRRPSPALEPSMTQRFMLAAVAVLAAFAAPLALAQGQLNLYCSSPNTAWCQGMAIGFEKHDRHEGRGDPEGDRRDARADQGRARQPEGRRLVGRPGDSYLQAAEEGLLDEYRSPNVAQLYAWAQRITEISKNRVTGVYGGILALGYNTELMAKKKLPVPKCWKDLLNPVYKNEVMLGNPNSSGTAYLMLATLVQIFGEDEAFKYMNALHGT